MSLSALDEPLSILILFPPWFFDLVFALYPPTCYFISEESVKHLRPGTDTKYLMQLKKI